MGDGHKLPIKRVELSLTKFNDVAIPHHLDLLRQHKANIIKYEELGDLSRVRTEQTHARRVAQQLRSLLSELESLRRQVKEQDLDKFDAATEKSRDLTLKSIMDYLETSPLSINRKTAEAVSGSAVSTESVGVVAHVDADSQLQLQVDDQELVLKEREAVLRGWSDLQKDVRELHEVWSQVHSSALLQREQVEGTASRVEAAAENVSLARQSLASAERLKAGAVGAGGAMVGALVGGPIGAVVGMKAAAVAALAGSIVGYFGARVLGNRRQREIDSSEAEKEEDSTVTNRDKKND